MDVNPISGLHHLMSDLSVLEIIVGVVFFYHPDGDMAWVRDEEVSASCALRFSARMSSASFGKKRDSHESFWMIFPLLRRSSGLCKSV